MMDLINDLKLSALAFRQMKAGSGEMMACVVVRGTFHIIPGQTLVWAEQQEPIQFEDVYQGDPLTTPLIRCSDIVPFKPKADLTLLGSRLIDLHSQNMTVAARATADRKVLADLS